PDLDHDLFAGSRFKERVDVVGRSNIPAAHRKKVVAGLYIHTRLSERRSKLRIPVLAVVDLCNAIPAVVDPVVTPKQSAANKRRPSLVSSEHKHVTDGQLVQHLAKQVREICTVRDGVKIWLVLLFVLGQVQTVEVWVIKEVALASPHLVVHLPPLGLWVDPH